MWLPLAAITLLAPAAVSATTGQDHTLLRLNTVEQQRTPEDGLPRKLHGRFLHITDIHPDLHYKHGADPEFKCHHGKGDAGKWGTPKSSCDTPWTLVNETFKWIDENLKDKIDFVIWTGDSARHDNDIKIPRTSAEIYDLNEMTVKKMIDVFGTSPDAEYPLTVPVVPTLGNNDIYPHNIMLAGPSELTKEYVELWKPFIPEDQYHIFHKGAYFWQQVVPGTNGKIGPTSEGGLAVFSLNTLYFYDSNTAVDGCDVPSEPGYDQMEWLNVQLDYMRQRRMKAIIIGHVPPAWTDTKMNWDESCWKKYVLWSRQYRDVIVSHLYGHMNLDHFMLHDGDSLEPPHLRDRKGNGKGKGKGKGKGHKSSALAAADACPVVAEFNPEDDPNLSTTSAETYLNSLREAFAQMVSLKDADGLEADSSKHLGGKWGERYVMTLVSPSVVPNYFPTLRVVEYNITGLVDGQGVLKVEESKMLENSRKIRTRKKGKKPDPPARTAPPGPAYSMQPYTFIGYTQYFLNLTKYNSAAKPLATESEPSGSGLSAELRKRDGVESDRDGGKAKLQFEVEYDTRTDRIYKLKDMTVHSYIKLARKIVDASKESNPKKAKSLVEDSDSDSSSDEDDWADAEKNKHKKKHRKKHGKRSKDKVWHAFVKRAFVGTIETEDLNRYEVQRAECEGASEWW